MLVIPCLYWHVMLNATICSVAAQARTELQFVATVNIENMSRLTARTHLAATDGVEIKGARSMILQ